MRNLKLEREESLQSFDNCTSEHDDDHYSSSSSLLGGSKNHLLKDELLLPSEYYTADFDPLLDILNSIPWEDNINDYTEDDEDDSLSSKNDDKKMDLPIIQIDNFVTQELSSLDELSQVEVKKLLNHIHQKEDDIKERMDIVRAIDCDISNALSNAKEAALYLQRARGRDHSIGSGGGGGNGGDGITGGLHVIEEANHRDKLRNLDSKLKACKELFLIEHSICVMCHKLDTKMLLSRNDYMVTLIEMCKNMKDTVLHEKQFVRLDCLSQMRGRISHIMESLCMRVEDELMTFVSKICNMSHLSLGKEWNKRLKREYRALFEARLNLNEHFVEEILAYRNFKNEDDKKILNFEDNWAACLLEVSLFEAKRCLAQSLLDPISLKGSKIFESSGEFEENLSEIRIKLDQLQVFDEDAASIQSMINNLLSIRFEFEKQSNALPWIFQKLCSLMAEVMRTYDLLGQFHEKISNSSNYVSATQHEAVHNAVELGRCKLWMHCKKLICLLLKPTIDAKTSDDFQWRQELENNYDILQLSQQISYLGCQFSGNKDAGLSLNEDYDLKEILSLKYKKYVMNVHVEAMNDVGSMMADDSWDLLPIPFVESKDDDMSAIDKLSNGIQDFLRNTHHNELVGTSKDQKRPWHNIMTSHVADNRPFQQFFTDGNPFRIKKISICENGFIKQPQCNFDSSSSKRDLYKKLLHIACPNDTYRIVTTQAALKGIGLWTVRLLTIRKKLPLTNEQIVHVKIFLIYTSYFFLQCFDYALVMQPAKISSLVT